jgi:hypothetical protein
MMPLSPAKTSARESLCVNNRGMSCFFIISQILHHAFFKRVMAAILIGIAVFAALHAPLRVGEASPPRVSLTAPPSLTDNKILHVAYAASDTSSITKIALHITPHDPAPGASNTTVEIPLPASVSKNIAHTDLEDLTAYPWAGQKITLQIVATNKAGKRGASNAVDIVLPERSFFHPIARALIEERKKLMQHPDDEGLRNEIANIMANLAHDGSNYRGDPVVLMALRSGAVRLVLEGSQNAVFSVNNLLWQAATRIEDGAPDAKRLMMQDAWMDLA